jgi:hypothetical protein
MDNSNHFHIAYYDATADELKYAVDVGGGGNCGVLGSAQCDTIDSMPADSHPLGVSIAEDKSYYPFIAYQAKNGSLNVARPVSALGLPGGSGNCGPGLSSGIARRLMPITHGFRTAMVTLFRLQSTQMDWQP